ncbi:hypothetical protein Tco_0264743 [Tanacetum coccineum]
MKQDKAKQVARDENLVTSDDRVKIGISNLRINPSITQREETFQIDVDIFRKVLDISPKVENQEFTKPPSSDTLREFLQELGYKGKQISNLEMYIDHVHQPWRNFAAIINKFLSGKTLSNDRLCLSQIEILWGMYHEANVDYAAMIWEDLQYQIDYRQTKLKINTQKAIKYTQRASRLKHKTASLSEGTGVSPRVPDKLTGVSAVSSERVGTSLKVPDETLYNYETQSDDDVWGSNDEETNKDKNEDDVSEEEEDEEESVSEEENVDEENEEESDDDKSFDITNTDDERTESDSDNHEMPKEGENVAETKEEETTNFEHEEDDTKGEDHKTEKEPKGDDQAKEAEVGVPALVTKKEKSEFLQSTFSHSISLNFSNQFLINSSNASLIDTIPENTDKEITSLMDIEIQQDVPLVQNEPFHEVKVSVIPEPTQQPPSTPPLPAIEDPAALFINFEAIDSFLHKFHAHENDVHELKQVDPSASILESIRSQVPSIVKDSLGSNIGDELQKVLQSHTEGLKKELTMKKAEYKEFIKESVTNEVKNQLSKILPKAVSDFATPMIQSTIKETLKQTQVVLAQSSSQP